jgi:hypothetical protein
MKALTKLPEKVKYKYRIKRTKRGLSIHQPAYVNVDFDEGFYIDTNGITCHIVNSKVSVTLWRHVEFMHVAIFK